MRRLCAAFLLLSAPAVSHAYSTYGTYVPPEGIAGAAQAATPTAYVGSSGTWGFAARVGAALPLGSQSKANAAGGMGGADVSYRVTPQWDLDLLGLYAAMPYTAAGGGSPHPLSVGGVALKTDYQVFSSDQTAAWVGVGAGLLGEQSTEHYVSDPGQSPVLYDTVPESSAGLALLAAAGLSYALYPQWTANLEVLVLSLDAQGGTSNNLLTAVPNLFVKWAY